MNLSPLPQEVSPASRDGGENFIASVSVPTEPAVQIGCKQNDCEGEAREGTTSVREGGHSRGGRNQSSMSVPAPAEPHVASQGVARGGEAREGAVTVWWRKSRGGHAIYLGQRSDSTVKPPKDRPRNAERRVGGHLNCPRRWAMWPLSDRFTNRRNNERTRMRDLFHGGNGLTAVIRLRVFLWRSGRIRFYTKGETMSIRIEQYRALQYSRDFMRDLLDPSKTPRVPKAVRDRASRCLRHYPYLDKNGAPIFSPDNFRSAEQQEEQ